MKKRLGVNIDHIATLREARKVTYPAPVDALAILKSCQVDQVTIHLREDRRHIQDHDLEAIINSKMLPVNLEMAVTDEIVKIACDKKPYHVTLVPEKREEVTTEGGLDVVKYFDNIASAVKEFTSNDIVTSLFIDPNKEQVQASKEVGGSAIEIHTGTYCNIMEDLYLDKGHYNYHLEPDYKDKIETEINKIELATQYAKDCGLEVYAGHGLHIHNLAPITKIKDIEEYNIGHAIIARAVFVGLAMAIKEIQDLLE